MPDRQQLFGLGSTAQLLDSWDSTYARSHMYHQHMHDVYVENNHTRLAERRLAGMRSITAGAVLDCWL